MVIVLEPTHIANHYVVHLKLTCLLHVIKIEKRRGPGEGRSQIKIVRKEKNMCPQNLYMNVHCSVIHNSPKVGTNKHPPTDEWINKGGISIQWNITEALKLK